MTDPELEVDVAQLALELGARPEVVARMLAPATRAAAARRRAEDPRDTSRRDRRRRLLRSMGVLAVDVGLREHVRAVERIILVGPYPVGKARAAA